jgi:hypothetical protein
MDLDDHRRRCGVGERRAVTRLSILFSIALAACGGSQESGAGTGTGLPASLQTLGATGDVQGFTGWSVPGLTLYRHCMSIPDRSTCSIVAVDGDGALVRGTDLWRRLPEGTPAERAARAADVLLGEAGQEPATPESDRSRWSTIGAEEWSVVAAPALDGDALVFYFVEGEMDPSMNRIRLDLASGAVTRTPALDVWVETAPAGELPRCEPVISCGCDRGCLRVDVVHVPNGGDRFRPLDADRRGVVHFRDPTTGALRQVADEACEESCPPQRPTYRCELRGETCGRLEP